MVSYTCEKCLKVFNKKCDFKRHIEHRKTPCDGNIYKISQKAHSAFFQAQKAQNNNYVAQKAHSAFFQTQYNTEYIDQKIQDNGNLYDVIRLQKIKNLEIIKDNYKCKYCNKLLSRLSSLTRHIGICKIKKDIIEQLKLENDKLKNDNDETEKLKIEVEKLKNEQKIKEEEFEKLKIENEKLNNVIINKPSIINNNNTVNNNININIVNYGEEDLSKLDLKKILQYDNSFIEMVFRDIHCNPIFPENQNILLPSLTRYDIYVKLNNEWLKRNKKEILTERYTMIRGHIMDLYSKESEINKANADNTYFHFLKQVKLVDPSNVIYKPQEEKKIIEGISNVLYNHKNNIKSIMKTAIIKIKNIK